MWSIDTSCGNEVRKTRHRIISYCRGRGLDIGCGDEKICPQAIGIDMGGKGADLKFDLSDNGLSMFSDNYFDYVFSSHCLEDFANTEQVLREWWRVIKYSGYLIIYCPDPDYYPRIGTGGCNPNHQQDLYWQDVWKIIESFGNAKLVHSSRHNESNEYSWLIVVQKKYSWLKKPFDVLSHKYNHDKTVFPRRKRTNKECLVIRYGALGDAIWVTPVLRQLKKDGFYIVYNCTEYSAQVLRENPNIDEFLIQEKDAIPNGELDKYWTEISKGFEKVINLSGSVEDRLLVPEWSEGFKLSHTERHRKCNINYQDETMRIAGYSLKGQLPELYFSKDEEICAQMFRDKVKDKFVILWSLAGSAFHKGYPWSPYIAGEFLKNKIEDVLIITVGDSASKIIEWEMPNTENKSGVFSVRQSMILTKYVDLVVGAETGIINAASCFETPKIVFLSHSSVENLTKYWKNCVSLTPHSCNCYPCHKLLYSSADLCPRGKIASAALCMENISPERTYKEIMKVYNEWKARKAAQSKN